MYAKSIRMSLPRKAFRKILQSNPKLRLGIQQTKYDVLGHLPQLHMRTGHQANKKQLTGVYLNQYYMDPIAKSARKVSVASHSSRIKTLRRRRRDSLCILPSI